MRKEQTEYKYDVFISYSHTDSEWVQGWLMRELERASLRVCIDSRDFALGYRRSSTWSRRSTSAGTPCWY